jgi:cytochrome c oxidase subunit 2
MFILIILLWLAVSIAFHSGKNLDHFRDLSHGNLIETIWTISPALILWMIGIPSLKLLYIMDNLYDSQLTIQIVGNQWYWSYTYSDYEDISYDSFLVDESDLEMGDLRMLTVDNYLVLPINTNIRLLITSNDVVHSFAIPSLGVKCDAVPGRLNSVGLIINRPSVFYGQCSELCGILHGFMPIGVKGVPLNEYLMYIEVWLFPCAVDVP